MPKTCPICDHPTARLVDRDLTSGYSVHHVSLKHFGDYALLSALRRHKRSHLPADSSRPACNNVITIKEWSMREEPRNHFHDSAVSGADEGQEEQIVAVEAMRVKGIVYQAGETIPESLWNPAYLSAALRAGTVRRKAS